MVESLEIEALFLENEWLTAEDLKARQTGVPPIELSTVEDWKRGGRVYAVTYRGKEYFARYQFDAQCRPRPIIKEVLASLGRELDPWKVAAWFHFPSGWLVHERSGMKVNIAPKDALDSKEIVAAARKRFASYVA